MGVVGDRGESVDMYHYAYDAMLMMLVVVVIAGDKHLHSF